MYADYGGFDQRYFEGNAVADPHPAGYSDYSRRLLPFDHYADFIATELDQSGMVPQNQTVAVVGAAYGFTVEWLADQYVDRAYGIDISQWAVDQAAAETTATVSQGDIRDGSALSDARVSGPPDVVYNECVLECLTDSEAVTAAENMRAEAKEAVVHRVWSADGSDLNTDWYNAKTLAEWQSLVDPNGEDIWYNEDEFQP